MNHPLISVILPVYNVEKHLKQCLVSISSQSYKNLEIILIIDGSKDNSFQIAKDYSLIDSRVSVYWQENTGSGPARNAGISHATGEYIAFIDPDDWIEDNYIERLLSVMVENNVDLVLSSKTENIFQREKLLKKIKSNVEEIILSNKYDVRNNYINLRNLQLLSAPTQKLFKRSIINDYQIEFPNLRRSQDIVFNYRYYDKINSLAVINYCGYQYRIEQANYALRLPVNYIDTIKYIYHDIKELHKQWGIVFVESKAVIMTNRVINAYIESMILRKLDFKFIFSDIEIVHIVKVAKTRNIYEKFMKYAIVHRLPKMIIFNIKIKRYVRRFFKVF